MANNRFIVEVGMELGSGEKQKLQKQIYEAVRTINKDISVGKAISSNVGRPPQTIAQEAFKTGRHAALAAPVYGAIYGGMASIQGAIQSYIEFDKVMTRIQMVSGKSTDSMKAFADAASEAGKKLSVTAKDYADASLIFFQQGGAAMDNAQQLAAAAIQLSNATGQAMGDSANSITAIMNSFGMLATEGEKTGERISDVLLKLDQTTASSGAEISDALTRFAAVAAEAGFSYEEAAAQVATISSATRLSAETIGTALKTFYANLQEVKDAGPEAAAEFTSKLQEVANKYKLDIHPFGPEGELLSGKEILDQIAKSYATMTSNTEKQDLVATIAGKHQITQVQALLSNWNIYEQNLTNAQNAQGATNEAQAIYAQSIQAHLNEMANAWEHFTHSVMESESFKVIIDFLTKMIQLLEVAIGGQGGLLKLTGLLTSIMIILNVDKITSFWNAMKSGSIFQTTQQMKLNALLKQEELLRERLAKAQAQGKGKILEKRLQANLDEQDLLKSGKVTGRLGSALKGGGIAAGLAGGIGILSDMSAGKSFGEAAVGNIGNVVGGAAGGAVGAAFGPMGVAIGGMIGAQIGDAINKHIINSAEEGRKKLLEIVDERATKYQQNKIALSEIVLEYKALNEITGKSIAQNVRLNELKKQLKELMPDLVNTQKLTNEELDKQISKEEYILGLKQTQAATESESALKKEGKSLLKNLEDLAASGSYNQKSASYTNTGDMITDYNERKRRAAEIQYQQNISGKLTSFQLKKYDIKSGSEEEKMLAASLAASYEEITNAIKNNTKASIENTLVGDEGLTLAQNNTNLAKYYTEALFKQGKTQEDVQAIIKGTFPDSEKILANLFKEFQAQEKLNLEKEKQKKIIEENIRVAEESFKKLSETDQLKKLQEQLSSLNIPSETISDLQKRGYSILDIFLKINTAIKMMPSLFEDWKKTLGYDSSVDMAARKAERAAIEEQASALGITLKFDEETGPVAQLKNLAEVFPVITNNAKDATTATDKFNDALDKFKEQTTSELYGTTDFENMKKYFETALDYHDKMIERAQALVNVNQLQQEVSEEIAATEDPAKKKQLVDFNQTLTNLAALGTDISKEELDNKKKEFEILKKIGQEQKSQNNQLILVRSAGGGFTYQYKKTAAQGKTAAEAAREKTAGYQEIYESKYGLMTSSIKQIYSTLDDMIPNVKFTEAEKAGIIAAIEKGVDPLQAVTNAYAAQNKGPMNKYQQGVLTNQIKSLGIQYGSYSRAKADYVKYGGMISSSVGAEAAGIAGGFATALPPSLTGGAAQMPGTINTQNNNQKITINATFPNAKSTQDIIDAFKSMSNDALQFNSRVKVVGAGV